MGQLLFTCLCGSVRSLTGKKSTQRLNHTVAMRMSIIQVTHGPLAVIKKVPFSGDLSALPYRMKQLFDPQDGSPFWFSASLPVATANQLTKSVHVMVCSVVILMTFPHVVSAIRRACCEQGCILYKPYRGNKETHPDVKMHGALMRYGISRIDIPDCSVCHLTCSSYALVGSVDGIMDDRRSTSIRWNVIWNGRLLPMTHYYG